MNSADKKLLLAISELANCNPFSPTRFEMEKKLLGKQFVAEESIAWNRRELKSEERPNVIAISQMADDLIRRLIKSIKQKGGGLSPELKQPYWDVATYLLLYRHVTPLDYRKLMRDDERSHKAIRKAWQVFLKEHQQLFQIGDAFKFDANDAAHLFACLTQVHRAFFLIFDNLLGDSHPIARLREKVWESIFSCNIVRYHHSLHARMRDMATLVTGPSGTGKELVARAVGLSQYIPFDPKAEKFVADHENSFFPLNLSALSPTLIESELFGHHRGAFTGAVQDRVGWLESCSPHGAVFLDEIGELDPSLQVKLLRVVQERTYCRLGETKERSFRGKIISATNRDLFEEINAGRFREDFYFRLCSDRIETPTLREQLDDQKSDLRWLTGAIAQRIAGEDSDLLADEVTEWIEKNLGDSYPWTGNMRELEQCVSSYLLRREYVPALSIKNRDDDSLLPNWIQPIANCTLTAEELLKRYCTKVYAELKSYEKTAQALKIDRRTVKSKIDENLLAEIQREK